MVEGLTDQDVVEGLVQPELHLGVDLAQPAVGAQGVVVVDHRLRLGFVTDDVQLAGGQGRHGRVADPDLGQLEGVDVVGLRSAVARVALEQDALTGGELDEGEGPGPDRVGVGGARRRGRRCS